MTNQHHCEMEIELLGRTWTMRGTHGAIAEMEGATGLGIAGLGRRFIAYEFGIHDVAVVIRTGIRAVHADAPDLERIKQADANEGFGKAAGIAAGFVVMILRDGEEDGCGDAGAGDEEGQP